MNADAVAVVCRTDLPNLSRRQGKVRDLYDLGAELLLVATDRISAYDVVLPTPIPGKGVMLTQISRFWFEWLGDSVRHHLIEIVEDQAPPGLEDHLELLAGRTMRCRRAEVVPIECVVRGYLAGSGWVDYGRSGRVCDIELPPGLQQCQQLPEPIFTPATKADRGHDENIGFDQAADMVGGELMTLLRQRSIDLYCRAASYARQRGIIIADTKFEWGKVTDTDGQDEFILIDEVLTPDSSRFWPAEDYEPGRDQDSFDKQYIRNYLTELVEAGRWDKTAPGPDLPDHIVRNTADRYREALERLMP